MFPREVRSGKARREDGSRRTVDRCLLKATVIWHICLSRDTWGVGGAWPQWNHRGFPGPCQKLRTLVVAQHWEYTKCHWTVHLKMINTVLCEFHLNRKTSKQTKLRTSSCLGLCRTWPGVLLLLFFCKDLAYRWRYWGVKDGTRRSSRDVSPMHVLFLSILPIGCHSHLSNRSI